VRFLKSLLFTTLMFVSIPPFAVAVVLALPLERKVGYVIAASWARFVLMLLRVIVGLRYQVEGTENIPKRNTVVLWKHQSTFETLVQLLLIPQQSWVLKRELLWIPFFGWGLKALSPIAIDRNAGRSAVEQVIEQGSRRLAEGLWINIFPEGTRMAPGSTRRYGLSGVLLAQANDRSVLPVAHNAGEFWPRRGWMKKPGVVRIRFGPLVETAGREAREVNREVQAWIESTVKELGPRGGCSERQDRANATV